MGLISDPQTPMSRISTEKKENFMMTSARSSSRNRGRNRSPTATAREPEVTALPIPDSLFSRIYSEFDKLRNCGMARRDFIQLIDKKERKSLSVKAIAFWQGVLAGLKLGAQIPTFSQLPYYQQYLFFAQRSLLTEGRQRDQACKETNQMKQNYIEFCTQIGKLKGLNLVMHAVENRQPEDEFILDIQ